MKISVSFTLLLLLGAVPASGSHDKVVTPPEVYALLAQLTASLADLKLQMTTGLAQLKTQVDKMQQQQLASKVAFSASLVAVGGQQATTGPLTTDTTLVFKNVPTNVGNAYSATTGMFTAPVRGVYSFEWTLGAFADGHRGSGAWLVKNTQKVSMAFEFQKDGFMSSSDAVTLLLQKGDVVFVRLVGNTLAFDDYNHHTTFSGSLRFLM